MKLIIVSTLLTATAVTAFAQNSTGARQHRGGPGGEGGRPPGPSLLVGAIDANHDKVISADEIANAPTVLAALDTNGDGQLTPDEFGGGPRGRHGNGEGPRGQGQSSDSASSTDDMPPPPPGGGRGPGGGPVVGVIDANHDHVISAAEIANASAALLSLDTNGDGALEQDEFCPPPPTDGGADDSSS